MGTLFIRTLGGELSQMRPFFAVIAVHALLVLAAVGWQGDLTATAYRYYAEQFAPLYFLALPAVLAVTKFILAMLHNPRAPRAGLVLPLPVLLGQLAGAAVMLAALILFLGSFTTFKTLMPVLMGGFPFDRVQADIDFVLHGSVDPGPALMALLGALEWNYSVVWMALTFVPVFFVILQARRLRLRYGLAFVLTWTILGNLLACGFLSAGPAFYGHVTGDTARFAGQMQALDGSSAAGFQSYLWHTYLADAVGLGTGISAFPSVHVGAAMMNALFLREASRPAGLAGLAYVAVVSVSSVLFGWHYAIDGYVSILVVLAVHFGLKRLLGPQAEEEAAVTSSPIPATR